jgi:hypothetical protein
MFLSEYIVNWITEMYEYYFSNSNSVNEGVAEDDSEDDEFPQEKPIIIVDVDGVILDFSTGFANWWNQEMRYDLKYNHTVPTNPRDWCFEFKGESGVMGRKLREYMDGYPMLDLFDESAPKALEQLHKYFTIIIVTAYPHHDAREMNLEMRGIKRGVHYDDMHCCPQGRIKGTKADYIESLHKHHEVEFVIEDCPEHVEQLITTGYTVYSPRHWNYLQPLFEKFEKNIRNYKGELFDYKRMSDIAQMETDLYINKLLNEATK